jgi:hypothetical protein
MVVSMAEETKTTERATIELTPQLDEPDAVRRPARLALYVGVVCFILGAVALYLGYNGAATNALVQAQMPYVISGGLAGLGLLALGGISIALYVILVIQADFRRELGAMREAIEQLSESISYQTFGSRNGQTTSADVVMVARGSSSFHRADCRLVERAEHTKPLPREEADREGMLPCRICKP